MDAVNVPFGTVIYEDGDFQLRWHEGHVYAFAMQYQNGQFTGKWEMEDFGSKENAKKRYSLIPEKFDQVCK